MVSEQESVLEDAELRDIIARYDAKFRKAMARYEASCESHFDQIMQILTRQESRFDQILAHQQTIIGQFRPTTEKYINPFTLAATSHSPHFTQTVTPTNHTTITTLPPKIAKASTIPPPTQISTTTHIIPHHTNYDQKNIKKIVNKIVQFHVLQVAVRDLNRFQHRNLPTPTRAAASASFKLHHTVHYISSIAVTTAVFPLPVFDPGGNVLFDVGAVVAMWVAFPPAISRIFALRTRHSKEGGMIRSMSMPCHATDSMQRAGGGEVERFSQSRLGQVCLSLLVGNLCGSDE